MRKSLWRDNAAQLSTELIIVFAAIIAVALLAVSSLRDTAVAGDKIGDKNAKKLMKELR